MPFRSRGRRSFGRRGGRGRGRRRRTRSFSRRVGPMRIGRRM